MISINLTPQEFKDPEPQGFRLSDLIAKKNLLYLLGIMLIVDIGVLGIARFALEPQLKSLNETFLSFGPQLTAVRSIKSDASKKQADNRLLQASFQRPFDWAFLMNDLSDAMIKGLWLTRAKIQEERINFHKKKSQQNNLGSNEERALFLLLEGMISKAGEPTAAASDFIQSLSIRQSIKDVAEKIYLERLQQKKVGDRFLYEFVIRIRLKEEVMLKFFGNRK